MVEVVQLKTQEKQRLVGWLRYVADLVEKEGTDCDIDLVSLSYVDSQGAIASFRSGNRYDSVSEIGLLRVVSLNVEAKTAEIIQ